MNVGKYHLTLEFAEAVIAGLALAAIGVVVGYFGCWIDSANRHIYTNRTVSAAGAATPRTSPGERSPPAAEKSTDAGDGRQGAAAWLAWLNRPAEFWLTFAAGMAIAFWALVELYDRLRRPREYVMRYEFLVPPSAPKINSANWLEPTLELVGGPRRPAELRAMSLLWPAGTVGMIDDGKYTCEAFVVRHSAAGDGVVVVELLGNYFEGAAKPGDEVKVLRETFRPYLDADGRPMQKRPHEGKPTPSTPPTPKETDE